MGYVYFKMVHFSQLPEIIHGKIISIAQDAPVVNLAIDSRKTILNEGTLFFAIKGDRHDGHQYLVDLYEKGVRQFVIEKEIMGMELENSNIILVESSMDALQKIAAFHRHQYDIPVVGITGSNGKTIVKEWLYQLLAKDLNIVKNPGSYNSQIGVPLSVWQLQGYHQLGIFEAGISKTNEMEKLEAIIKPSIGIFTNIGPAHDEGFDSTETKISEKLLLFKNVKTLIYCKDYDPLDRLIQNLHVTTLSWGVSKKADIHITKDENQFKIDFRKKTIFVTLPFNDHASVENAFHCIAFLLLRGYNQNQIQERINILRVIPMRLELKEAINHCQIIDDTYNNDLAGLRISLDFLSSQQQKKKKKIILSDILQSGLEEENLVKNIAAIINEIGAQSFIGIGPVLSGHKKYFTTSSEFYPDTESFLQDFNPENFQNEMILVKGARIFQFEKIVNRLQKKVHGTVMEIDLGAMVHNLNFFKSRLKPTTKIMVMVKALAYGSGSNEIASLLQYHKVDYLGVAYADEGIELRKNNISLPIMVMNPSPDSFSQLLAYNLEPEIYSFKILRDLLSYVQEKPCKIHIKFDSGMHRLGFEERDLQELTILLKNNPQLHVASVFSHLAGADESVHDAFSSQQANHFLTWSGKLSDDLGYKPIRHILNSPGALRLPDLQLDMIRLGIGLYGVDPTAGGFDQLIPIATLKTIISQIKQLLPGESIGYGRRGKADKEMKIATIAIGYADGFSRAFSGGVGEVLVNGKPAKVVGNVCMDMTMIDITDIDAKEGDEVIIFGKDMTVQKVASRINTIPYEILTNTSERVKRIFVAESI